MSLEPVQPNPVNTPELSSKQEPPKQNTTTEGQEATKPDPRLAQLARQERAFREKQKAFLAEKKQWELKQQQLEGLSQENEKYKSWQQRLAQDPYGVMLEAGITSDKAAALLLNQPDPSEQKNQMLLNQIKALEDKLSKFESGKSEEQDQSRQAAKKQILHDVRSLAVSDKDNYEVLNAYGDVGYQAVVELIEKTFDSEGYVMDTDQAIKEVEDYLTEEAMKAAKLKKIAAKISPPVQQPQAQQQKQPQIDTLSNRMVPSGAKALSERERRERAILAFQGKL